MKEKTKLIRDQQSFIFNMALWFFPKNVSPLILIISLFGCRGEVVLFKLIFMLISVKKKSGFQNQFKIVDEVQYFTTKDFSLVLFSDKSFKFTIQYVMGFSISQHSNNHFILK